MLSLADSKLCSEGLLFFPSNTPVMQPMLMFMPLLLLQIKLRENATRDHMLEHLTRWQLAGGNAVFVELPAPTPCASGPGACVSSQIEGGVQGLCAAALKPHTPLRNVCKPQAVTLSRDKQDVIVTVAKF